MHVSGSLSLSLGRRATPRNAQKHAKRSNRTSKEITMYIDFLQNMSIAVDAKRKKRLGNNIQLSLDLQSNASGSLETSEASFGLKAFFGG